MAKKHEHEIEGVGRWLGDLQPAKPSCKSENKLPRIRSGKCDSTELEYKVQLHIDIQRLMQQEVQ